MSLSFIVSLLGVSSMSSILAFEPHAAQVNKTANETVAPPTDSGSALEFPEKLPEALRLSRYNFAGNVLHGTGNHVKQWVIIFCTDWHERCRGLVPSYELLGAQWEEKLNAENIFESSVRFAKVDCAVEKELCISQEVDDYPTVMRYQNGHIMGIWTGGAPGLVRWIKQELTGMKPRQRHSSLSGRGHANAKHGSNGAGEQRVASSCSTFAGSASSGGVAYESLDNESSLLAAAASKMQTIRIIAGFLLMLAVGIGHLSTPQLLGPQPRPAVANARAETSAH
mmetsp:Transcript_35169/g.64329  ORF Transcript_35169/g.64329 Transcript_35169/m.64329 type:complete len:282 (-) Transcript_35169:28-873(-)